MKMLYPKEVTEVKNDGFNSLLGQTITLFCAIYIYTGKLVGVGDGYLKLEDAKIVYETGPFDKKEWAKSQSLPNDFYVCTSMIESFGVIK